VSPAGRIVTAVASEAKMQEFSYRSARSGSLLPGLGLALVVETVAS
jgi:hypothetical protein